MSAFRNGPDTVICTPKVVIGKDRTGSNLLGPGKPVTYKGVSVQPAGLGAFADRESLTIVVSDYEIFKPFEPAWVGGPKSTVDWNGEVYEQEGVARRFGRGRRTRHEVIRIKLRRTEVK